MWYTGIAMHINKLLQMSEDTNNPVYKLTTINLQLEFFLNNVLNRSII